MVCGIFRFHAFFRAKNQRTEHKNTDFVVENLVFLDLFGLSGEASASSEEARIGASAVVMGVVDRNLVTRAIGSRE